MRKSKLLKILVGVVLVFVGLAFIYGENIKNNAEVIDTQSFSQEPVKLEGFNTNAAQNKDLEPVRVVIPSISIDLPVNTAKIIKGYWQVFPDTASWGEGSGVPGQPGNQVIFAHARKGLFLSLKDIQKQARIYVFNNKTWFSYTVSEIKEVYPSQVEVVKPTEDETLTLYTCSGYKDSKRLIVVAKRAS